MAWDFSSSTWDWDTDGAIAPDHVTGLDHRKLLMPGWACEAEQCEIKHDRPFLQSRLASENRCCFALSESSRADLPRNGDFLSNQVVTPAMANLHSSVVFHDAESPRNMGSVLQARVPIVTTCTGGGVLLGATDHTNGSLEIAFQKQYSEIHGNAVHQNLQDNENGSWFGKATETEIEHSHLSGEKLGLTADFSGRDQFSTSKGKIMGIICNGTKAAVKDEQHNSVAKGSVLSEDSPTELQLGKRTYPQDGASLVAAKESVKSNAAGKKGRGSVAASQVPRCQVEGCKLDLSSAKDYHRRHKVCEPHSKAGKVMVASLEQRFCQQCSRFHILTEFDETKRSCRRRLAGHNKRRRKPRPGPLELQAQLRSSFEDWPYFYQSRFSRLGCWQDAAQSRSGMLWPRRLMQYHEQPDLDCSLQGSGTDMFMKGLSSSLSHDKFPLLLLQSPKTVTSMNSCDRRVQNLPEVVSSSSLGNSLRLSSSASGAGVFTNTDTAPGMEVSRVSNSGRALSLLSLQLQCSQAPDMVSLDLSGLTNTSINDNSHQIEDALASSQQQFLLHGPHLYCQDFSTNLSINSNAHHSTAANVCEEVPVATADKDLFECSYFSNWHKYGGEYEENHNFYASKQLQSHGITGPAKETQDLMQSVSFQVPKGHCQSPSTIFNIDSSALSDANFSAETSFLRF